MKLFPTVGAFIFWLIWPYIITRIVGRAYLRFTGKPLPKTQHAKLRRELARITRGIMNPNPPDKEPPMAKPRKVTNTVIVAAACGAGVVLGAVAAIAILNAAFRVPKDLKRFVSKPR